ncbi:RNA-guided endonuclease TnpB family protein [Yaniella flava]|uniref:RNA-guided endonuclease TnpB family protein n=1 Tax=Yaniella flava TaxID=287930 RepID=A0ABP5G2U6_9MICC
MKLRYQYKLRPGRQALALLTAQYDATRWVWNQCVERFTKHQDTSQTVLHRLLTKWRSENSWLTAQPVVPQQQIIRDFVAAKNAFFKGQRKPPRFKAAKRSLPSLNYTLRGFSLPDGRLRLAGGVIIPVVWSRDLPSEPSSVRVYQDAAGWWWASFVVERQHQVKSRQRDGAIGIDWGVKTPAKTTDGQFDLHYSQRARRSAAALKREQRKMARHRAKRDWQPYRKAKAKAATIQRTVRWQRKEQARSWAQHVAANHLHIACEDFKPAFLATTRMARKAAENAIGLVKTELAQAAQDYGATLHLIDPKYTTMDCSTCGTRAKRRIELSQRTYACNHCGTSIDRDLNAARNMIIRAGFNPADHDGLRPQLAEAA